MPREMLESSPFGKFELPHFRGRTIVVVGMHLTLTNDDLMVESSFDDIFS